MEKTLKIVEIFNSVQGEGSNAGMQMTFVRLFGCSMRCAFCDTKESWEKEAYTEMSISEIINHVKSMNCQSVCITGGEPMEQDIDKLVYAMSLLNYWIAIETNGSFYRPKSIHCFNWIAVSPKAFVHKEYLNRANEIKFVIEKGTAEEFNKVCNVRSTFSSFIPTYLQAMDNNNEVMQKIVDFIPTMDLQFRLGFQIHKFYNVK